MNLIIPVAGEGTRLRPHTHTIPKSLLYVAGKPILGHILDNFRNLPIEKLVIVLGAKGEAIMDFCRTYPFDFKFVHQKKRLGLGHAIHLGARGLKGPTLILLGDTIIEYDFKALAESNENFLAVKEVPDPRRFGIVSVRKNRVIKLVEKPKNPESNLAIVGLYYFRQIEKVYKALTRIIKKGTRTKGEYQLTDALQYLLDAGEEFKILKIKKWYDCGTPLSLIQTNQHLLSKLHHYKKRKGLIVISPVYIDDSAKITNSIIGPHVSVGKNAVINDSIIKNSIINSMATVQNALLSGSIIGENAVVKGGYKKLNVSSSSVIEFP